MTGSSGSENTGTSILAAQRAQLLDGGGALEVGADEQRITALGLEPAGQLGRRGGLAGALQTGHQHDGRGPAGVGDLQRLAAENAGEFAIDDLDDLLARIEHLRSGRPDRLGADAVDDLAGHADVDVGIEQGGPDLAQDLLDVGFGEPALAAQALDDPVEAGGESLEHFARRVPAAPAPQVD